MNTLRFYYDGNHTQRISLDPGFPCPHGRCTFCGSDGSRARHLSAGMSIAEQVERGKAYLRERYKSDGPYTAYFQAFTGTNAPIEKIRQIYEEALAQADFTGIVIGTRPDCISDECLDYLTELKKRYDLLIELGVQTANDETLRRIHRGHDFACAANAVKRLAERNIPVAAHLILGLPGETAEDWRNTAREIGKLPFRAVKMHQLLVLKGTKLAAEYAEHTFPVLNEYEYAEALECFLRELPEGMEILRLTADSDPEGIIAPKWWMKKGQFREMFLERFANGGGRFTPCRTEDGSYTLYHPAYRQHFHSIAGAKEESFKKYIEPAGLAERLKNRPLTKILDVGFGLGCNASGAFRLANDTVKSGRLEITSLEFDRNVIPAALMLPDCDRPFFESLRNQEKVTGKYAELNIQYGDARKTVQSVAVQNNAPYDVIFLDGFSPDTNPELWTADFIKILAGLMAEDGVLVTYSSAYPLFGALLGAGLKIFRPEPFGRRRPGTAAAKIPLDLPPLSQKDLDITTKSTAGIPYRDSGLRSTREQIFARRKEEVAEQRKSGMPKWYK